MPLQLNEYEQSFKNQIKRKEKELENLKARKELLKLVGSEYAVVGEFPESVEYSTVVKIGDHVRNKDGEDGIITGFDFTKFNESGHLFDILVIFTTQEGEFKEKADSLN